DLANGEIWLRQVKGDRTERVYLGRDIRDHLVGYVARKPKRGPLFRGPRGERLGKRCAQKRVTYWLGVAGVEHAATAHALRHTFATRLLRRTGDLFLVKQALGHRSILSTVVYLDLSDERLRAAMLR
ncbi:MAG: tyrosine-type recombinase/integrase, partial [Gemmatimonadaceae bacterium]|nr:tyrosine-type recombinase/integrase [Gemmatimonadaceae bacterium]